MFLVVLAPFRFLTKEFCTVIMFLSTDFFYGFRFFSQIFVNRWWFSECLLVDEVYRITGDFPEGLSTIRLELYLLETVIAFLERRLLLMSLAFKSYSKLNFGSLTRYNAGLGLSDLSEIISFLDFFSLSLLRMGPLQRNLDLDETFRNSISPSEGSSLDSRIERLGLSFNPIALKICKKLS